MSTVADIMSKPALTVEVSDSLWDAWQLLFVSGLRHLVVLDASNSCIGVLSDRNILAEVPLTPEHLGSKPVRDVMTRLPVFFAQPGDDLRDTAHMMTNNHAEAFPVVDADNRLVGIVTETDMVRWMGI